MPITSARTAPPSGFCRNSGTEGPARLCGVATTTDRAAAQTRENFTRIADTPIVLLPDKLDATVQCVDVVLAQSGRIHQLDRLVGADPCGFDHRRNTGFL